MSNSTIIPLFIVINDDTRGCVQIGSIQGVIDFNSGSRIYVNNSSMKFHSPLSASEILARIHAKIDEAKMEG